MLDNLPADYDWQHPGYDHGPTHAEEVADETIEAIGKLKQALWTAVNATLAAHAKCGIDAKDFSQFRGGFDDLITDLTYSAEEDALEEVGGWDRYHVDHVQGIKTADKCLPEHQYTLRDGKVL